MKKCLYANFAFQSQSFAQAIENLARTCVRLSVCFRNSGFYQENYIVADYTKITAFLRLQEIKLPTDAT